MSGQQDGDDNASPPAAKRQRVASLREAEQTRAPEVAYTVARQLRRSAFVELKDYYESLDEDGSGKISADDVTAGLLEYDVASKEVDKLVDALGFEQHSCPYVHFVDFLLKLKADEGDDKHRDLDDDEESLFGPDLPPRSLPVSADTEADSSQEPLSQGLTGSEAQASASRWHKENLPPPLGHELEFLIKDPKSYSKGQSIHSHNRAVHGSFGFRLLVFPMGTESSTPPNQLAVFVEAVPPEGCEEVRWAFEAVKYQISVVNWKDYRTSVTQTDMFTFTKENSDRGWHKGFVKASQMTTDSGWLNDEGELCLRASCQSRRAMLQHSSRKASGYVGLKNHGATCYMNCLLQTLYCLGHFRHIAYSIDIPEAEQSQAVVSSDDISDGLGLDDDPPALPLLVSLQNLFYRLQTSEAPVSCRELMRSFGWDTADAFMQHDAQELNRLLCDRLEEQMKGTATDGEIKRLFEGEFENYIECVDVDYRSQRMETFYDLQLNVRNEAGKDITSLEESLRDFTSEEMLEGDNAYDAGSEHGKQRARKGIRFKRFPPVLYIQLKRFMFDPERMDMNKLNGKMEFPQILDLEAFAKGSGKYMLHTVIVHSGGVSSGHYYTFVRVQDGDSDKCRWVKFDDECVTFCSEQAAVEDNYGGEDLQIWDYFKCTPKELRERSAPSYPKIHNAYMLSYVRMDMVKELLAPPVLDSQEQKYKLMIERCTREAALAEERRRARYEQLMRVEVKLVLEKDLMAMKGFWHVPDIPIFRSLKVSREDSSEELCREIHQLLNVPAEHMTLFVLGLRKTRQMRFKHLGLREVLKNHLTNTAESYMIVLALVSRGYDPHSLKLTATEADLGVPHAIRTWEDADIILLIVKYYCPVQQILLTLGCWYEKSSSTLQSMLAEPECWLTRRLQPHIDSGEVAPLPADVKWQCWEEFLKNSKDIQERDINNTIKKEGLFSGDIVVWNPLPSRAPSEQKDGALQGSNGQLTDEDGEPNCFTVKEYAEILQNRIPVNVRQFIAEAPWCPEGIEATGVWTQPPTLGMTPASIDDKEPFNHDMPQGPGELSRSTLVRIDQRMRVDKFALKVAQDVRIVLKARDPTQDIAGRPVWLFQSNAPSVMPLAPILRTEALPSDDESIIADLLPNAQSRVWNLTAVVLPHAPPQTRPVAVHFFDARVREAGACILHVKELTNEESRRGESTESMAPLSSSGRPAVHPEEILEMARQHLEQAEGEKGQELRRRMRAHVPAYSETPESEEVAESAESEALPPLRVVEVCNGRIRRVYRSRQRRQDAADEQGSTVWPARGQNLFCDALRVEPDFDFEEESPCRLVEVFHLDRDLESPFGHPLLLRVNTGRSAKQICADILVKLGVAGNDLVQMGCKFLLAEGSNSPTTRIKYYDLQGDLEWPAPRDDLPAVGWCLSQTSICIERIHPMYMSRTPASRSLHTHKPLTIRAA